MRRQLAVFLVRWLLNSFGLWLAVRLFGTGYGDAEAVGGVAVFLLAGFIFSVINSILKPIIIILSLPAILITLGLFVLVVNGFMVYISLKLTPGLHMSFLNSILTGIILSLINYIVSSALELSYERRSQEKK